MDVETAKLSAVAIDNGKSQPITESRLLSGLKMSVLEEALRHSWTRDQTQIGAWLLKQFQSL